MRTALFTAILLIVLASQTAVGDPHPLPLTPLPIQEVVIDDPFWTPKLKTWR